jgi:hypothetical protein
MLYNSSTREPNDNIENLRRRSSELTSSLLTTKQINRTSQITSWKVAINHPEILKHYIRGPGWPIETAVLDDLYARCELCPRKRSAVPYVNLKQATPIPVRNWEWMPNRYE